MVALTFVKLQFVAGYQGYRGSQKIKKPQKITNPMKNMMNFFLAPERKPRFW